MVEYFIYPDEGMENEGQYKPGGYHPVTLGDVLPKRATSQTRQPRYRIMQKLGHGAFATIWLARDLQNEFGYVALKINISSITGNNNEITILRSLQNSKSKDDEGYHNVVHLLDDFTIQGPNGIHDCLVVEVVIGLRDLKYNSLKFDSYTKLISPQFMAGLSYLHKQGVTHGDLHSENLGLELLQLNNHSEQSMNDYFGPPTCIALGSGDSLDKNPSVPPYLTPFVSLAEYLEETTGSIANDGVVRLKIMDFGNSFRRKEMRPPPNTPLCIRSPEVTFCEISEGKICSDWDRPIDIWAAACTLYELNYASALFYRASKGGRAIYQTLQLAGPPLPPTWQRYWDLDKYCAENRESSKLDPELFWSKKRALGVKIGVASEHSLDMLIDLLRKMLQVNPSERPQISTLLGHPWLSNA